MNLLFDQIFNLLISPPGNLAYHLVLVFSVVLVCNLAFHAWRGPSGVFARRLGWGALALLTLQLLQFLGAGLAWQSPDFSARLLPALDRLAALFSLLILVWLWLVPAPSRAADAGVLLAALAVQVGLALGLVWWNAQPPEITFNQTWLDIAAQVLAALLALAGLLGLLTRRPEGWASGLTMFGLLFTGHAIALFYSTGDDYQGSVRLFQMAAYPWLMALSQRLSAPVIKSAAPLPVEQSAIPDRRRYSLDPKVVSELLALAADPARDQLCQQVTRIIGQMMLADYTLLITPPDQNGKLTVACGYNLIEEKWFDGFSLDSTLAPGITSAMRRNRILRLPASSSSSDLQALGRQLHLGRVGHLMVVPIAQPGATPRMGLIVISPYSNRGWSSDDQNYLQRVADFLAFVLWRQQTVRSAQTDAVEIAERLQTAQKLVEDLHAERSQLVAQLDLTRQQVLEERARAESLAALIAHHDTLAAADPAIQALSSPLASDIAIEQEHLQSELDQSLAQVAQLRQALAEADFRLIEAGLSQPGDPAALSPEVKNLLQEMRQPLASISGYADILLGETTGILGSQQRKFVERIKAAVERSVGLADEIISMLEGLSTHLSLTPLQLDDLIDDAVSTVVALLRSKNIVLRVDVPPDLPLLRADRQALLQVLGRLLQNAAEATPNQGEILLRARAEQRDQAPAYILIQIVDQGGGVPPELLPQIFSRIYAAEEQMLPGLGLTRQGLAEIKTLVEVHAGRLWIDSLPGQGSTFSALFPVADQGFR